MSLTPGSFRPNELVGADPAPSDADLAATYSMARELEAALPAEASAATPGFADRVMAAVALESAPQPAGFLAALRVRPGLAGLAGLAASVREAWAVATRGTGRPFGARGLALAYVFAVVVIGASLTGIVAYGAAGALGFLDGDASPTPAVIEPSPTPSAPVGLPSPEPTSSSDPEPSGSGEPAPSGIGEPDPSDDQATASPRATTGPGVTPPPASSIDPGSSPSPSADDGSSPNPSDTPGPSDTPKPSATPN